MIGQSSYYGFIIVCLRLFIYKNYDFFMKKIISPSYYSEATIGTRGWTNYNLGEIKHFLVHTKIGVYSSFTNIRKFVK